MEFKRSELSVTPAINFWKPLKKDDDENDIKCKKHN